MTGGVLDAADRAFPGREFAGPQAVFEVHPNRTGGDDVGDRAADRLGRIAIAQPMMKGIGG